MRFAINPDGSFTFEGRNMIEEAQIAFDEKRFIEAFVILHSAIDFLMIRLYQNYEMRQFGKLSDPYLTYRGLNFKHTLHQLLKARIVSTGEQSKILDFDESRNRIIHRIFLLLPILPFQLRDSIPEALQISFPDVKNWFESGIKISKFLAEKFTN